MCSIEQIIFGVNLMIEDLIKKTKEEHQFLIDDVKYFDLHEGIGHVPAITLVMANYIKENQNIITVEEIGMAYLALFEEFMNHRYSKIDPIEDPLNRFTEVEIK